MLRLIPLDEKETRFQLEERKGDGEGERKPLDDQEETPFQLEETEEDGEEEKIPKCVLLNLDDGTQSGCRPEKRMADLSEKDLHVEKLDSKGDNQEPDVKTPLVEDVVGEKDEESSTDELKESFERLESSPKLPLLENPLPTGVACCLTRLKNPLLI